MRAIICLILVLFSFVFEGSAETVQAVLGSRMVAGEMVGVTHSPTSISVKIRQASGEELEVEMYRLEPSSRDKVIAWMSRTARVNAFRVPHLKFSPSKQVANVDDPMATFRISGFQTSGKSSKTEHVLAALNTSGVSTGGLSTYQLVKQIKSGQSSAKGSTKLASWEVDSRLISSLQPQETKKIAFRPLVETSSKKVTTATASRGGLSRVDSEQVKIEAVYLMAFDDAGNLIYFAKV